MLIACMREPNFMVSEVHIAPSATAAICLSNISEVIQAENAF